MKRDKRIIEKFECSKLGRTAKIKLMSVRDKVGEVTRIATCYNAKKCGIGERTFLFHYNYNWLSCVHPGARRLDKIWTLTDSRDYTGLVKALDTGDWKRAADALFSMSDDEEVVRALIYVPKYEYWDKSKSVLVRIGKPSISHLIDAIEANKNNGLWSPAFIGTIIAIGDKNSLWPIFHLITDLDADIYVRGSVIDAVAKLGNESDVGPVLRVLASDLDRDLRATAAYCFSRIPCKEAIKPLIDALFAPPDNRGGARPDLHGNATYALEKHGEKYGDVVVEAMIQRLRGRSDFPDETKKLFLQVLGSSELYAYAESYLRDISVERDGQLAYKVASEVLYRHSPGQRKQMKSPVIEDHITIVKKGIAAIAEWRKQNPGKQLDLRYADLSGSDLPNADLRGANLTDANLSKANLQEADLSGASLINAGFSGANLTGTNLRNTDLTKTRFKTTVMSGADLSGAQCGGAVFADVDFSEVLGLEEIECSSHAYIGYETATRSKGKIPNKFLETAFLSKEHIEVVQSLGTRKTSKVQSCFISYSSHDDAFARKLYNDLQKNGVVCWFAPEDMNIGDKIRPKIDKSIKQHDKLLLVLSRHAVMSGWVEKEVETAFEHEKQTGQTILLPIRIDDAVLDTEQAWAADIRRMRHIGDFLNWEKIEIYNKSFERLLKQLK